MGSQASTSRYLNGSSKTPGGTEISETAPSTSLKKVVDCEIIDEAMVIDDKKGKAKGISKFDIVDDSSDHYYAKRKKSIKENPHWVKKIQEEWKILEKDLPDAIFVRVYESRMDLLRAVIVGAEGTPYRDGLFFFDFLFPDNYPYDPPEVYYHSGGLRINPNLYNSGRVCLSLLGTWGGSARQKWLPEVSTMLQVLVSIQGLILNAEPYFNEPGYERYRLTEAGKKSSLQYNETTFLYNLETMVYTMKRPPKHFEELVRSHFCERAHHILVSCKAYLDGAQVGGGRCSANFKCKLANFMTTLIGAFTQTGAKGCDKFLPPAPMSHGKKRGPDEFLSPAPMSHGKKLSMILLVSFCIILFSRTRNAQ